jgi:hypothetical protein
MDKIEGFFGTLTPLQRAINRATDKSVREANWELNLDIIDEINRGGEKKYVAVFSFPTLGALTHFNIQHQNSNKTTLSKVRTK